MITTWCTDGTESNKELFFLSPAVSGFYMSCTFWGHKYFDPVFCWHISCFFLLSLLSNFLGEEGGSLIYFLDFLYSYKMGPEFFRSFMFLFSSVPNSDCKWCNICKWQLWLFWCILNSTQIKHHVHIWIQNNFHFRGEM